MNHQSRSVSEKAREQGSTAAGKAPARPAQPGRPGPDLSVLHGAVGNQAVQRLARSGALQAKLSVGKPDDVYEQEADRVAGQVMRMPESTVDSLQSAGSRETGFIQAKPG